MASIILGTVQFGLDYGINNQTGKPAANTVIKILSLAEEAGIDTLDTAEAYGNATALIGKFHEKSKRRFKSNTKFTGTEYGSIHAELVKSIEIMRVTQVETLFYHSYKDYEAVPQLISKLQQLKKERLINNIGLSVYSNDEFETAVNDESIDVIQLPFNLLDNYSRRGEYLQLAKEKKKRIQVRSVFLQGLFFKNTDTLPAVLTPLQPYLQELHKIANENEIPMESLCLGYANSHNEIDEIIIGVDSIDQLHSNLTQLSVLPRELCKRIDQVQVKETALLYPYNWK